MDVLLITIIEGDPSRGGSSSLTGSRLRGIRSVNIVATVCTGHNKHHMNTFIRIIMLMIAISARGGEAGGATGRANLF